MEIIRQLLKKIVIFVHILVALFMVVGFLFPSNFLFYFLLVWPTVYFQWQINENRCILTDLEYYLDGKTPPPGNNYEFPFVKKQLANLNIQIKNDMQIYYFFIYLLTVFWIIGFIRYIIFKKCK